MPPETKPDAALVKHTYIVQEETWIGPHLKEEGEEVQMTELEAKYYVPHVLKKKSATTKADAAGTGSDAKGAKK